MDEYASSNSYSVVLILNFIAYKTENENNMNISNKYRVVFICAWPS